MTDCCSADWRLEILDILSGNRVGYLSPTSFNFEEKLNEVGTGSVTVPVHSVTPKQVWPDHRMVAFLRIDGPGASPSDPVCEFIGIIEQVSGTSDGVLTLGLVSMEGYFRRRLITQRREYVSVGQNEMAADIINKELALTEYRPPIEAVGTGGTTRTRTYKQRDYKIISDAIEELTQLRNGPDYKMVYRRTSSGWDAVIRFQDHVGSEGELKNLDSRRGLAAYSVNIDATNHVNRVYGVGSKASINYTANESLTGGLYPRLMRSEQYSDVKKVANVQRLAEGSLDNDIHPRAQPSVTVADMSLSARIDIGDRVALHLAQGALRFKGDARVIGKAWSVASNAPTATTFSFVPYGNSVNAILKASVDDDGCC